jgi:hypothetical protein
VRAGTFLLLASGGDGTFADGNEIPVAAASVVEVSAGLFRFTLAAPLASDTYRIVLKGYHAGGALELDGTDDFALVPADAAFAPGAGSWTVECWVAFLALARENPLVECADLDFDNGWRLRGRALDDMSLFAIDGDALGDGLLAAGPAPVIGQWIHLAGVFDAATAEARLYADGQLVATDSATPPASVTPAADLLLGRFGADHARARVDEVRIWETARTAAEIDASRFQRITGAEPGLRGAWSFDEGAVQGILDASPFANDGTLGADAAAAADDPARIPSAAWAVILDALGAPYDLTFGGTVPNAQPDGDLIADFVVR